MSTYNEKTSDCVGRFVNGFEPIVPDPAWGLPSPTIDPEEWIEDDEDDFDDD